MLPPTFIIRIWSDPVLEPQPPPPVLIGLSRGRKVCVLLSITIFCLLYILYTIRSLYFFLSCLEKFYRVLEIQIFSKKMLFFRRTIFIIYSFSVHKIYSEPTFYIWVLPGSTPLEVNNGVVHFSTKVKSVYNT